MSLWSKPPLCDFCKSPVSQTERLLGRAKQYHGLWLACDNCSLIIQQLNDIKSYLRRPSYRQLIKRWWKIIPVDNDPSEQARIYNERVLELSEMTMPPHPEDDEDEEL